MTHHTTKMTYGFYYKTCLRPMIVSIYLCSLKHWNGFTSLSTFFGSFSRYLVTVTIRSLCYLVIQILIKLDLALTKERLYRRCYDVFTMILYFVVFKIQHSDILPH